ncbi:hypothetical protein GQ43DRAFT_439509 [Delitschia confertaspora ATCC 74209]|uniref:MARVEL domain-containing protein n=1 Tax=Delitschia confertaspora ATCC 74209 TaxID=1513339 RepID=A0A9P4JQR3_9PLEO|nr:hypothetical protein GQ43DRAFT_439509 [Delitschia confertaspora ATCC 74209]
MAYLDAFILPLRLVQAVFSVIVLGLTAYIVDVFWDSPNSVNFMLFTSLWTLLVVAFLVIAPSRFPQFAHKYVILALESITMIFWFAAWIAVAALWGDWKCGSKGGWCGAGTAACVFSALLWLTFLATAVMAALHVRRTPKSDTTHDTAMEVQHV